MKTTLRSLLVLLLLGLTAHPIAAVSPSHPGFGGDPFVPQRGDVAPEGTAILNVDTAATFPTLQDAINAATAGDTLEVQVATHTEGQILVDRDLTIRGATGTEVVQMAVDTGSSGDARAWFLVNAGVDLTVRDLTFDGNGFLVHQAFRHRGSGLFERCTFRNIQFNASGPDYAGSAIVAFGGTVDVRDCTFEQIGRVGVLLFGSGVAAATAQGNRYTGKGDGDFLDYGIEVGAGATATLADNEVSDCRGIASVDGSTSAGLLVSTFFGAGTEATLTANTLTANDNGFSVGFNDTDSSVVTAAFNRLVGNLTSGARARSTVPLPAEDNWWGCNAGPGAAGCDGAATVGPGVIDTAPWLVLGLAVAPLTVPAGGVATATADLVFNSDGVDTSGAGTVPDDTPVAFASTLGTMAPTATGTTAGTAASTFTAGVSGGTAVLETTVDNQTVSTGLGVEGASALEIPAAGEVGLLVLALLLAWVASRRLVHRP